MAVVQELIRTEDNGTISFGDYELNQKSKLSDYQYQGDMYKVKHIRRSPNLSVMECSYMSLFREPVCSIFSRMEQQ